MRGWRTKHVSKIDDLNRRDKALRRWRDRAKEYMNKRGSVRGLELEKARRECPERERWGVLM